MKIIALASIAAVAALAPVAAGAQTHTVTTHTETRHVESHTRAAPARRTHQVCTVRYEHHHKVRSCRTVRG